MVDRSTGQASRIAALSLETEPGYPPKPTAIPGGVAYGVYPWTSYESAVLFADGWTAIARLNPFRVDWRTPAGRWILGRPLPTVPVRVDEREKAWFMESDAHASEARSIRARGPTVWPNYVPPFTRWFCLVALPDGQLAIRRNSSSKSPESRYDIIDRAGTLRRQIVFGANEELRLVGPRYAYVVVTDDDGVKRIRRYQTSQLRAP